MSQVIPITSQPYQTFQTTLSVDGASLTLQLTIYFSEMSGYWIMDIYDQYGNALMLGIPLITGSWPSSNILMPYQYLEIGSAYVLNIGNSANDYPGINDFATGAFSLVWDNTV